MVMRLSKLIPLLLQMLRVGLWMVSKKARSIWPCPDRWLSEEPIGEVAGDGLARPVPIEQVVLYVVPHHIDHADVMASEGGWNPVHVGHDHLVDR